MEIGSEINLQPTVAKVLDADLQVKREIVQVETEAMGLYKVSTKMKHVRGGGEYGGK